MKLKHWRGFQAIFARRAAPVLEFGVFLTADQAPGEVPKRLMLPEPATDCVTLASP